MWGNMKISKAEIRIMEYIRKNIYILYLAVITIFSLAVRWSFRWHNSYDLTGCLNTWFYEIKEAGGLAALKQQVGNYNIIYQTIIALMTYLPFSPTLMYKLLSVIFDYVLAAATAVFAYKISDKSRIALIIAYCGVIFMPSVVLNSSAWGQCDSIYTSFVIIALILLSDRHYTASFILLGIAFTFKLQFIFILPFFIYHYFSTKSYSLLNFLLVPLTAWGVCLPIELCCGRSIFSFFTIYAKQCEEYMEMSLNIPNIWSLIYDSNATAGLYSMGGCESALALAMCITAVVLGTGLVILIVKNINLDDTENMLLTACWTVWSCLEFLPQMHERYTYMLDILMVLLAVRSFKKYTGYCIICVAASFITYSMSMYGNEFNMGVLSAVYLAAYCIFTANVLKICTRRGIKNKKAEV